MKSVLFGYDHAEVDQKIAQLENKIRIQKNDIRYLKKTHANDIVSNEEEMTK
ncbi:MAG: hypothetical protein RR334_00895 [Clostridia bacterium]